MRFIADLHIHSHYSRATSKASNIPSLAAWARIKGVHVIGTGDFTHPLWFQELKKLLEPAEPGFFRLQKFCKVSYSKWLPEIIFPQAIPVRFILSTEVSCIYKRGGRVRKVHVILFAPDFTSVKRLNRKLASFGNLSSDGRPVLALDCRDLLEIMLENCSEGFLVPAHIWTPWFSVFGSRSGFDSIEECFGDLSKHIFALETGLSSDPALNRLISQLDRFTLISNSDCHSPGKLCREANIFDCDFNYFSLRKAIKDRVDTAGKQVLQGTIEFYPEEGKYHYDGHRKCGVCSRPVAGRVSTHLCPKCGKPLTIGVLSRIMELADRLTPEFPEGSPAVYSLIPLIEILSEITGVGVTSKTVMKAYLQCVQLFGSELNLLLLTPVRDISEHYSPILAEAVNRVRKKEVFCQPGYDGIFGKISVFHQGETGLPAV